MGLPLIILTIAVIGTAFAAMFISLLLGKYWISKFAFGGVLIWILVYGALLFGSSIMSQETNLALNEPKQFCGFYLDCHMYASVIGVRKEKTFGRLRAKNEFHIVTVKIFSDAKRAKLKLTAPKFTVIDAAGNTYRQTEDLTLSQDTFERRIEAGENIEGEIAFDLPSDIENPRLDIREGFGIDHMIEAILIGDEDSILHKRTYFMIGQENLASIRSEK